MEENFIAEGQLQSFEKTVDRLEEVVKLLEKGDVPLEQSMALFSEGAALIGACEKMLDDAEQIVSKVDVVGGKNSRTEMVFDVDEDLTEMLFDDSDEDDDD